MQQAKLAPIPMPSSPAEAELSAAIKEKLVYGLGKSFATATDRDWYHAAALAVRDRVVDVWTGAVGQEAYGPANEGMKAFFQGLRQFAPQERIKIVRPLPHSPLQ